MNIEQAARHYHACDLLVWHRLMRHFGYRAVAEHRDGDRAQWPTDLCEAIRRRDNAETMLAEAAR